MIKYLLPLALLLVHSYAVPQAVPVARYAVNSWVAAETVAITTARRAAANDARYWPATAANDATFKVAQANTITAMQQVAKKEALSANTSSIVGVTVLSAGAAVAGVAGAPVWLTALLTIGVIGIDINDYFTYKKTTDPSNHDHAKINYRPVNTPAGVRLQKTVTGSEYINTQSMSSYTKVISNGGIVLRTQSCNAGDTCESLPAALPIPLGYRYSASVVNELPVINSPFIHYKSEINNKVIAYFKNFNDLKSYLMSLKPCSASSMEAREFWTGNNSILFSIGPVCTITNKITINANYDNVIETVTIKQAAHNGDYIYRSTDQNPLFFEEASGIIYTEYSYATYDGYTFFTRGIASNVVSQLDLYGTDRSKISLGSSELAAVASPELMANTLNKLWLKASQQPDYRGLPYSPTNPITAPQLRPVPTPTLNDLLREVLNPDGEVVFSDDGVTPHPIVQENPDTEDPNFCTKNPTHTSCKTNPNPDIDLTAPPATEPKLSDTPTANSILQPLLNLLPGFRNTSITHVAGVCPTVSFNTEFGDAGGPYYREWTIDHHCTMFEDFRAQIQSIFLVLFAFATFRIVMRA